MYFDDHGLPHFHIVSADENASVAIDTLELLSGSVSKAKLKEAKAWAADNKQLLQHKWEEFSS